MMYVWGRVHACNGMYVEVREFIPEVRALWFQEWNSGCQAQVTCAFTC